MRVDWDNLQSIPMSDREARALGELIDYIDEFSMLHGRAKGKLRELVIELVSAQFEATEPLSDIAIDAETLRVVWEIHEMVSECSGHIGRMANPAPVNTGIPVDIENETLEVAPEPPRE